MTPFHIPDTEAVFSVKHALCLKREGNKNASVSSKLLNKSYGLVNVFLRFLWKSDNQHPERNPVALVANAESLFYDLSPFGRAKRTSFSRHVCLHYSRTAALDTH